MNELRDRLQRREGGIYDADRRYLMMRVDVLMGILHQLPAELRPQVLAAMADSVTANGGKSAQAYFESIGRDRDRLLEIMVNSSADLGWGLWRFIPTPDHTNELLLEVRNSPFAAGHGPAPSPVCAPITGMLRAMGTLLLGPAQVEEVQCSAQGHEACRFTIRA